MIVLDVVECFYVFMFLLLCLCDGILCLNYFYCVLVFGVLYCIKDYLMVVIFKEWFMMGLVVFYENDWKVCEVD